MGANLIPFLSQAEIAQAVKRLAGELDRDYYQEPPVFVGVLKGGFIFLSDLVRWMKTPIRSIEFLQVSSYGSATSTSGRPRITVGLPAVAIAGQHVVVVEDIVETGMTTRAILRYLGRHRPASIRVCVLLDKPSGRRVPVEISYTGFTIPDRFVVGYGLDWDQALRHLPDIRFLAR
jgi:hypoxanthine phosphoribosyltransferase